MASNIHFYWKPPSSSFSNLDRGHLPILWLWTHPPLHRSPIELLLLPVLCSGTALQLHHWPPVNGNDQLVRMSPPKRYSILLGERGSSSHFIIFFAKSAGCWNTKMSNGCTLPTLPPFLFLIACGPFGFTHPPLQPCHTTARHQKVFSAPFRWIGWKLQA